MGLVLSMLLLGVTIGYNLNHANALYEDQSYVCKQENHTGESQNKSLVCIMVNDDNVFSKDGLEITMNQFKHDLDTFSAMYLENYD